MTIKFTLKNQSVSIINYLLLGMIFGLPNTQGYISIGYDEYQYLIGYRFKKNNNKSIKISKV
tara:strand:+ start:448 stop:633 length:186 start_codon:yes stop_codon:yes gene_type:complete